MRPRDYGLTADTDPVLDLYDDAPPEAIPTLEALGGALSGILVTMAAAVYVIRRRLTP